MYLSWSQSQESCIFHDNIDLETLVYRFSDDSGSNTGYKEIAHLNLNPRSQSYTKIVSELERIKPNMGVEILFELPYPSHIYASTNTEKLKLLTALQRASVRFSTMKNIEYYSHRRKKFREFITDAFLVSDPQSTTKLPDPTITNMDDKDYYVRRTMTSFGESVQHYQVNTEHTDNVLVLIYNLEDLVYNNIIKIANKEESITIMYLHIQEHAIAVYLAGSVRGLKRLDGLRQRATISMSNRLCALAEWFYLSYNDVLKELVHYDTTR